MLDRKHRSDVHNNDLEILVLPTFPLVMEKMMRYASGKCTDLDDQLCYLIRISTRNAFTTDIQFGCEQSYVDVSLDFVHHLLRLDGVSDSLSALTKLIEIQAHKRSANQRSMKNPGRRLGLRARLDLIMTLERQNSFE